MSESTPPNSTPPNSTPPVEGDDAVIGVAVKWSIIAILLIAIGVIAVRLLSSIGGDEIVPEHVDVAPPVTYVSEATPPTVQFVDVTESAGLDFVQESGATGEKLLPETMGAGAAFFDYDNDGDQDLLLVNSDYWPEDERANDEQNRPTMALYANDGSGSFTDVTVPAGLDVPFYGVGVAVGDYDNDGDRDLFIAALGENRLFRNDGGVFADVTQDAGVGGEATSWSTSTGWFDMENDGDLDLFVCNYVRWNRELDFEVDYRLTGIGRAYGPPTNFIGTNNYLYRNDGGGRFTDVSESSGIQLAHDTTGEPIGKALALAFLDFDRDGLLDVFVANDTVRNFLYRNLGGGTFEEVGVQSGVAFDRSGNATGAMGIDAAAYREDELIGVAIGNFSNEMTSLYRLQSRSGLFVDEAITDGVGPASRLALSFGLFFFDYDLDGRLDLFQVNGHLEEEIEVVQSSQKYEQAPQLFWNAGPDASRQFVPVDLSEAGDLAEPLVGRGAAYADIDDDGDLDMVVTQSGRRAALYRNDTDLDANWLRLRLIGTTANRDSIGAVVELEAGGRTQRRLVSPTRSYLSQAESTVTFGLGEIDSVDQLRIVWPGDVDVMVIDNPTINRTISVTQP